MVECFVFLFVTVRERKANWSLDLKVTIDCLYWLARSKLCKRWHVHGVQFKPLTSPLVWQIQDLFQFILFFKKCRLLQLSLLNLMVIDWTVSAKKIERRTHKSFPYKKKSWKIFNYTYILIACRIYIWAL